MRVETLRPYFLLGLLIAAFVLAVVILEPFLAPLAMAAIFAVVLRPLYRRFLRLVGGRPALAALGAILVFILCVLVPVSLVATQIVNEASGLYAYFVSGEGMASLYAVAEQAGAAVSQLVPGLTPNFEQLAAEVDTYLTRGLQILISHLGGILSSITGFVLSSFVFFIALYYLLKDGSALKKKLMELSPLYDADEERVFGRLELAVNSVVKGSLLIAGIQGALATIGFLIFGLPNPALWGTVTAISALIPGVGTSLVMGPAIVYLFVAGELWQAVGLGVWAALAVGLVDNMLGPRLIGKSAELHPLLILLSVLGGLALFGAAGIFLGPLSIALLLALLAIHAESSKAA